MGDIEQSSTSQLDEWRKEYTQTSLTREGEVFESRILAQYLISQEFKLQEDCQEPSRQRVLCIDDGIMTLDYRQRIVPISGSGIGERGGVIHQVLSGVSAVKIKPHRFCGKAALVLGEKFKVMGKGIPTQEQVDFEAIRGANYIGALLNLDVGRMLDFDDRVTRLVRPTDFHPADGAVLGLSGDFLHNLIPTESETPVQFKLAGHYYYNTELLSFAISEALLANRIASSDHGIGVMERGFRITAIVNAKDHKKNELVRGAIDVKDILALEVTRLRDEGENINDIYMDILEYSSFCEGGICHTRFELIE